MSVCEAWADVGRIPKKAIPKIKKAYVNLDRMAEILKITHHDVTAFISAVGETHWRRVPLHPSWTNVFRCHGHRTCAATKEMPPTCCWMMLMRLIKVIEDKAIAYKDTLMIGRTHGVHAEPITFGLKLALWAQEMKRNQTRLKNAREIISVGKISGAVGTYATVSPEIEEQTCARLDWHVPQSPTRLFNATVTLNLSRPWQ